MNVSIGTIFSVLKAPEGMAEPTEQDFLQPGTKQVAAGYAVYGPQTVLVLTTGTMLLMWLGEQITERGIGNGVSLIIFAGIVAGLPSLIGNGVLTDAGATTPGGVLESSLCLTTTYALKLADIDRAVAKRVRTKTYYGQALVARPRRLALMNLYLHGVGGDKSPQQIP